jgi:hypothetical protein
MLLSQMRRYLQSDDELASTVAALDDADKPLQGYMRAVYFRQVPGEWKFVTGQCMFGPEPPQECTEIYSQHAFVAKHVRDITIRGFFENLARDGVEVAPGLPLIRRTASHASWKEEVIPSHARDSGLPGRRLTVTLENNAIFVDGQLVDYALPYRLSASRYATAFLGLPGAHDSADGRKGEFFVELTDRRGAIRLDGGRVSIARRTAELRLVGIINGQNIDVRNDEGVQIESKSIRDVELWLLAQGNAVVDCLSTTEWPYRFDVKPEDTARETALLDSVRGGESETCEFKPYIDLNSTKAMEIEKTVCAFSNQRGGMLFVGITKEGDVVGVAKDIAKRGEDLGKAIAEYEKKVHSRLRESLKDNQCFTTKVVNLLGTSVIVVAVEKTREINYLVQSEHMHMAYIRHGATSMKMSPPEMKAMIERTRSGTGSLF